MPYIFRVIKVGQKADAPHGARLNTAWKNDKQKTAYAIAFSDWSSDVCSSDLT